MKPKRIPKKPIYSFTLGSRCVDPAGKQLNKKNNSEEERNHSKPIQPSNMEFTTDNVKRMKEATHTCQMATKAKLFVTS